MATVWITGWRNYGDALLISNIQHCLITDRFADARPGVCSQRALNSRDKPSEIRSHRTRLLWTRATPNFHRSDGINFIRGLRAIDRMSTARRWIAPAKIDGGLPAIIVLPFRPPRVLVARHCMSRSGPASRALPCKQHSGGARETRPSAIMSGTCECTNARPTGTLMCNAPKSRQGRPGANNRRSGAPRGEHPALRDARRLASVCGSASSIRQRVPRKHPSAYRRSAPSRLCEGNDQTSEETMPREKDETCAILSTSFRDASAARGPGIHTPQQWLWIPGSPLSRRPGMTGGYASRPRAGATLAS